MGGVSTASSGLKGRNGGGSSNQGSSKSTHF
jgi:hypothetical protein